MYTTIEQKRGEIMAEDRLLKDAAEIKKNIKKALLDHDMKQIELARLIDEGEQQVSRAVNGGNDPKSVAIRRKIYRVLDMTA